MYMYVNKHAELGNSSIENLFCIIVIGYVAKFEPPQHMNSACCC